MSNQPVRIRLDLAMEARGLLPSRARARDAILRGTVSVNGVTASKPHQLVANCDKITMDDAAAHYVSRAALKLVAGLDAAQISANGKICLDAGASTGGFTQVLIERGAKTIYAVDVGHSQLSEKLKFNPHVVGLESQNVKDLTLAEIPLPIDLLVADLSFVSVTKVLGAPLGLCRRGADAIILIKPQFEAGREHVGKGGIVRDAQAVANATVAVGVFMAQSGWGQRLTIPSPITGGDGNSETIAVFSKG